MTCSSFWLPSLCSHLLSEQIWSSPGDQKGQTRAVLDFCGWRNESLFHSCSAELKYLPMYRADRMQSLFSIKNISLWSQEHCEVLKFFIIMFISLKLYCGSLLYFYRVSGKPVTMFFNAPRSATVLQCQRANSKQALLLPPDVLDAAGLWQSFNIPHPAHLWFQLITGAACSWRSHPLTTGFGDRFAFVPDAAKILHRSDKKDKKWIFCVNVQLRNGRQGLLAVHRFEITRVGGVYLMPASLSEDRAQAKQPFCVGLQSGSTAGGCAAPSGTPAGRSDTAHRRAEPSARPVPAGSGSSHSSGSGGRQPGRAKSTRLAGCAVTPPFLDAGGD